MSLIASIVATWLLAGGSGSGGIMAALRAGGGGFLAALRAGGGGFMAAARAFAAAV
jgi:hypothetical protein